MVNMKIIVLVLALCVMVAAIAGFAFSQYASAQANATRGAAGQQGGYNGYYPNGGSQYGNPYGYSNSYGYRSGGMGMGMCGRFW